MMDRNQLRGAIMAHRARATRLRQRLMDDFDVLSTAEKLEYLMLMALDAQASVIELNAELVRHLKNERQASNAYEPRSKSKQE